MKIIQISNYDLDHVPDELIAENVSKTDGEFLIDALNRRWAAPYFYCLVDDDYKLRTPNDAY